MLDRESRSCRQILVIDDREEDREMLCGILQGKYSVYSTARGEEGLGAIQKYQPDLVLLDIYLTEGIDGVEVLRRIRKKDKNLPVIIISGAGTYEKNVETYRLGASDFIAKPYDISLLHERIEKIFSERSKGQDHKKRGIKSSEKGSAQQEEEFFKKEYINMIQALCELIELKNPYTHRHSQKVTKYAVAIAEQMGLSYEEIEQVKHSGLIHDIGKVGIVDAILNKPGRLTNEEFEEIKKHPVLGTKVLKHLRLLQPEMAIMVHHHERWDGNGYPDKLKGNKIPKASRILAVADSFDAMISNRAYRRAQSLDFAVSEIQRCSGTQFDPEVVEAFFLILKKKPHIVEIDQPLEELETQNLS